MNDPRRSRIRSPRDEPAAWVAALTSVILWGVGTVWLIPRSVALLAWTRIDFPTLALSWAAVLGLPSIVAACSVGILRGSWRAAVVASAVALANLLWHLLLAVLLHQWNGPRAWTLWFSVVLLASQLPAAIRFRPGANGEA